MRPERITAYTDLLGKEVTDLRSLGSDTNVRNPASCEQSTKETDPKTNAALQREISLATKPDIAAQIESDKERALRLIKVHPIELLMQRSRLWLSELDRFQHVVENPDGKLDVAISQIKNIVRAKKQEVFESLSPREQFDNFGYVSENYFRLHNLQAHGNIAVIISGPTGVGKGTIISKLLKDNSLQLRKGIGNTTRPPRSGEVNGVDYFFLTKGEFEQKIKSNELLEWTIVHNEHCYGYSEKVAQEIFDGKKDHLMELDPKGARFYRYLFNRFGILVLDVFISPVPKDTLKILMQ